MNLLQRWCPNNLEEAIIFYQSIMQRWLILKKEIPSQSYFELRLEDLVKQPDHQITRLCNYIGIIPENSLFSTNLAKSNHGRWQKDFSPSEKKILQERLSSFLKMLNYQET